MSASAFRLTLEEARQELSDFARAWSACTEAVRGPHAAQIREEFVDPYTREYRRSLGGYEALAGVMSNVERELNVG